MPWPLLVPLAVAVGGAITKKMQADKAMKANLRAASQARKEYGENYIEASEKAAKAASDQALAQQMSMARGSGTASSQASAAQAAMQRQGEVAARSQLMGAQVGEGFAGGITNQMGVRMAADQEYQRMRNEAQNALIEAAGAGATILAGSGALDSKTGDADNEKAALAPSGGPPKGAGVTTGYGRYAAPSYAASNMGAARGAQGGGAGYSGVSGGYGTGGGYGTVDAAGMPLSPGYDNDGFGYEDTLQNVDGPVPPKSDERLKNVYGSIVTGSTAGQVDDNPHNVAVTKKVEAEAKPNGFDKANKVLNPLGGAFGWTTAFGARPEDAKKASDFVNPVEWFRQGPKGIFSDAHSKQQIQKLTQENMALTQQLRQSREPKWNIEMGEAVMEDPVPGPTPSPAWNIEFGDPIVEGPGQWDIRMGEAVMEEPVGTVSDAHSKQKIQRLEGELSKANKLLAARSPSSGSDDRAARAAKARTAAFRELFPLRNEGAELSEADEAKVRALAKELAAAPGEIRIPAEAPPVRIVGYKKLPDGSLDIDSPIYAPASKPKPKKIVGYKKLPDGSIDIDAPIYAKTNEEGARAWTSWTQQEADQYNGVEPQGSEADRAARALAARGIGVSSAPSAGIPAVATKKPLPVRRPSMAEVRAKLMADLAKIDAGAATGGSLNTPKPTTVTPDWLMSGELSDERTKQKKPVDRSNETSAELSGYTSPEAVQLEEEAPPIQFGTDDRTPYRHHSAPDGSINARNYTEAAVRRFLARYPDYKLDADGYLVTSRLAEHGMGGVGSTRAAPVPPRPQRRDLLAPPAPSAASHTQWDPARIEAFNKMREEAAKKATPAPAPAAAPVKREVKNPVFAPRQQPVTAVTKGAKGKEAPSPKATTEAAKKALEKPDSDEKVKKVGARTAAAKVFEHTPGYAYEYKPEYLGRPGTKPGMQVGIMAQDLEKTAAGKTVVNKDRQGIRSVDTDRLTLLTAGAMNDVMGRLKELEKRKKGRA